MTNAQTSLLRRLMAADRAYWCDASRGVPCSSWDRGVEVGAINGVDPRTADSLEALGLAESTNHRSGHRYLFLYKVDHLVP